MQVLERLCSSLDYVSCFASSWNVALQILADLALAILVAGFARLQSCERALEFSGLVRSLTLQVLERVLVLWGLQVSCELGTGSAVLFRSLQVPCSGLGTVSFCKLLEDCTADSESCSLLEQVLSSKACKSGLCSAVFRDLQGPLLCLETGTTVFET